MKRSIPISCPALAATALLVLAGGAASPLAAQAARPGGPGPGLRPGPAVSARSDTAHAPYTAADVQFMSGMIRHHAQAVLIAGWAPGHGAGPAVRALCARIVVGQRDEIGLMARWLADRHEAVPAVDTAPMMMSGMEQPMLMPGMLTADQLAALDQARGRAFDGLFLRDMIQHHQGAITMVNQLFAARGGGEEETVFRFATNIFADQTTEIARMQRMLAPLLFDER